VRSQTALATALPEASAEAALPVPGDETKRGEQIGLRCYRLARLAGAEVGQPGKQLTRAEPFAPGEKGTLATTPEDARVAHIFVLEERYYLGVLGVEDNDGGKAQQRPQLACREALGQQRPGEVVEGERDHRLARERRALSAQKSESLERRANLGEAPLPTEVKQRLGRS